MELKYEQRAKTLTLTLPAEIDHHSAKPVREETDRWIAKLKPESVVIDFSGVKFMDSSGIGLILGRYNKVAPYGGRVVVECADRRTLQLLRLAGVQKLVEIKSATM
ncbi:MAG: STAS domain-containing protein [Clostridia bacterium]|nr:STAS domain-containing protein [Clostridia bacterium]